MCINEPTVDVKLYLISCLSFGYIHTCIYIYSILDNKLLRLCRNKSNKCQNPHVHQIHDNTLSICATQHGRPSIVAKTEVETACFGYETGGDRFGVACA